MIAGENAKQDFKKVIKGTNMMTPNVLAYYYENDYAVELSEGTDFDHNRIYGVTVVNTETNQAANELSQMFHSKSDALHYISSL